MIIKKKQTFRNGLFFYLGLLVAPIFWGGFIIALLALGFAFYYYEDVTSRLIGFGSGLLILGLSLINLYCPGSIMPRLYSKLTIYPNKIKWSCLGYKSVFISFNEIKFIGIADADEEEHPPLTFRGDEGTYIYFSKVPTDYKYQHKIFRLKNKKGFIYFKYSDKLYLLLTEYFPENDLRMVRAFYNKMQIADRDAKKEKEKEKRRKKELRKRKKPKSKIKNK